MSQREATLFKSLYQDSLDVIIILDSKQGIIQDINRAVFHLLGYQPEELIGKHVSYLYHLQDEPQTTEIWNTVQAHGTVIEAQKFRHADGSVVYMDVTFTMIALPDTHALLVTLRDATERQYEIAALDWAYDTLEQRLHVQTTELSFVQLLLQEFFHHAPSIIFAKDLEGRMIMTNSQFDAFFHAEPGTLLGKTDHDLLPASAADAIRAFDLHVLQTGRPAEVEHSVPHAQGERTYATIKFPIYDALGNPYALGGVATDITEQKKVEAALRTSQEHMHHLLSASPVVIFSSKADGDYGATFVSENIRQVFGYEPHEFTDDTQFWAHHMHPDDAPRIFADMHLLFVQGHHHHEYRFLHKDGTYRWVENHLRLICDREGNAVEIVGSLQDISRRKKLEQDILLYEQRLNAFFIAAPAGLVLLDSQYRFINVNETAALLNGVPRDNHIGRPVDEVLPKLGAVVKPIFERVMATGVPLLNVEVVGEVPGQPEVERFWLASYFPVPGVGNQPANLGVIFIDLTEQKKTEAMLQQSRDELEQRVAERTAELAETNTLLVQEIEERQRIEDALAVQKDSLAQQVEEQTRDLKIANARLAHAARLKDEFLANMSHELRTPLNAILGLSEALQEEIYGPLTDRQLAVIQSIEESGLHLLDLINDILDLAKIESGKTERIIEELSVEAVCQSSLRIIKQIAQKKHIQIFETIAPSISTLRADERRLKQILVNLLSNAVKFTPEGGQVGIDVQRNVEHQAIIFTVWDTGIGISPEHLRNLFNPFVQLDSGLNRQHEGTGLGLALVSRLAEMHGGGVSVESVEGEGSRFMVALPYLDRIMEKGDSPLLSDTNTEAEEETEHDQAVTFAQKKTAGGAAPASSPPLILIAEDNEDNIAMLSDYLQSRGYRVAVAHSGTDAIESARREPPALILMDIQMPGMDGLEATRRIRTISLLAQVPILAITALAMPGDRERCLEAGATDYMSKPVSLKKLLQFIQRHTGSRSSDHA